MATTKQPQSEWGKYVLRVLEKHNSNPRQQRLRTKLSHTTIYSWLDDVPPNRDGVIDFAQGMGEDINEALQIAGKKPIYTGPAPDSREAVELVMGAGLRDLSERYNAPHLTIRRFGGWASIKTVEEARAVLAELEEDIQAELAEIAQEKEQGQ